MKVLKGLISKQVALFVACLGIAVILVVPVYASLHTARNVLKIEMFFLTLYFIFYWRYHYVKEDAENRRND